MVFLEMAFQNHLLKMVNHWRTSFFGAFFFVFFSTPCWILYQVCKNFYLTFRLFSDSNPFRCSLEIYICRSKRLVFFVRNKSYLCYRLPEVQVKYFFRFIKRSCFVIEIFRFLYFQISTEISNLWCHDEYYLMREAAFLIYLLNHNSLVHETWSPNRCNQGQYFVGNNLKWFGRLRRSSKLFLTYGLAPIT